MAEMGMTFLMKLLSVAIPCYNSQDYMAKAINSVLPAGDAVEVLVIDDGSKDGTLEIAREFERAHPDTVRVIHQENSGHGGAVMTGIRNATGRYFKVLDSDDWVNSEVFCRVLDKLASHTERDGEIDLFLTNYVYDKVGVRHKYVVRYTHAFPQDQLFGWPDVRHFRVGQYIQMHSIIYRTELLRECGLELPKHTFYVDELYAYVPLTKVERMLYLDENLYHYFIGRADQSVQEDIMIRRIDQAIRVQELMVSTVKLSEIQEPRKKAYMLRYLEIITTVCSVMLIKSGTAENRQKKRALWAFMAKEQPDVYIILKRRFLGRMTNLPGQIGRRTTIMAYKVSRKIIGFN